MTTRVLNWFLLLVSVVAYQGLLAQYLCPGGTGLRYDLLVVFLAGLTGGAARGAIAGGLVGFLTDCLTPSFLGWGMMVNASMGLVAGMSRDRLFLERISARWLVCAVCIAAREIIYLLPVTGFDLGLYGRTLWFDTTVSVILTSIVGTAVLFARQSWRKPAVAYQAGKSTSEART